MSIPSQFTPASPIEALPFHGFTVNADTLTKMVADKLINDSDLPGILITVAGKPEAVISRFRFESHMKRAYSIEIYSKRAIAVLLDSVKGDLLLLPPTTPIPTAASRAFEREELFIFDPIVVPFSDGTYKLLDCTVLVKAALQILTHVISG